MLPYLERLQGIDAFTPSSTGDDKQIPLGTIPVAKNGRYGYVNSLLLRLDLIFTTTHNQSHIPIMDLYRVISRLELTLGSVGTLIAPTTRGIDMAAWHMFARNGYERKSLRNGLAELGDYTSGAGDTTVHVYFRIPFVHHAFRRPQDFALPGAMFGVEDSLKLSFAASTAFTGISTSSVFKSCAVKAWAEMFYSKSFVIPAITRLMDNTENRSTLTVGPFAGADLMELVLCGDLHGLGSSDGLDNLSTVEWEPRIPPVVPQTLAQQFVEQVAVASDAWPMLIAGQSYDGLGYQSLQYAALLPLKYANPRGQAKLSHIKPNASGEQIVLAFTGSTISTRYLMTVVDRWDEARATQIAKRVGLKGSFRIKGYRSTNAPTGGSSDRIDPEHALYLPRKVIG
jgi:hypothetical protein